MPSRDSGRTVFIAAVFGGWAILLIPFFGLIVSSIMDGLLGDSTKSLNPDEGNQLKWRRILTTIWLPVQIAFVFTAIVAATQFNHLPTAQGLLLMAATGGVGIIYAHDDPPKR